MAEELISCWSEWKAAKLVIIYLKCVLQVSELRASRERLARDKASLTSELTKLRCELSGDSHPGLRPNSNFGLGSHLQPSSMAEAMQRLEQLSEVERAKEEALQRLESVTRARERSEREWQLERQQLQVSLAVVLGNSINQGKGEERAQDGISAGFPSCCLPVP